MPGLLSDLRVALRGFARAPAFAIAAVATLAVAIAVNAALFSFLNAIFLRPLPYPEPERLHRVDYVMRDPALTPPTLAELRAAVGARAVIAAYEERQFVMAGRAGDAATVLFGTRVEPVLARQLGWTPVAGRLLETNDALPGAMPVVTIAEDLAQAMFGSARASLGGLLRLDAVDHTVVGVLPARTAFPDFARLWVPYHGAASTTVASLAMLARVPPGASVSLLRDRIQVLRGPDAAFVRITPLMSRAGGIAIIFVGALAFLLLIACSNVANLVLTRGMSRLPELSVRTALGASRMRLLRASLVEGAALASIAAVIGGVAGVWLTDVIIGLLPADQIPLWFEAPLDLRVLAWIAAAATVSVLVASGLPALSVTHRLSHGLTALARVTGTGNRLRAGLMATQLALATILLAGAGLMATAFQALRGFDPGYDSAAVLQLRTFNQTGSGDDIGRTIALVAGAPGVRSVAARLRAVPGGRAEAVGQSADAALESVTPAFFETLGLPLAHGRTFRSEDEASVVVVAEVLATRLFGSAPDAIGRTVTFTNDRGGERFTVIGVAASRRVAVDGGLGGTITTAHAYVSPAHGDPRTPELLIRADVTAAAEAERMLRAAAPGLAVLPARTLAAAELDGRGEIQFFASLFGGFGVLALLLAALGIYGVVAYSVARRTREIGLRVALGATSPRIVRQILHGVVPAAFTGLGVGALGASALGWLLRSTFFGIDAGTPSALLAVLGIFLLTTIGAALIPALRAARVDPIQALKQT